MDGLAQLERATLPWTNHLGPVWRLKLYKYGCTHSSQEWKGRSNSQKSGTCVCVCACVNWAGKSCSVHLCRVQGSPGCGYPGGCIVSLPVTFYSISGCLLPRGRISVGAGGKPGKTRISPWSVLSINSKHPLTIN